MRIVSWNCNGALRKKLEPVNALEADILVIQECEDPALSTAEYRDWAGNYLWTGFGKNKGIGIFPRRGQSIERLEWPASEYDLFLPARIGGAVDVLGVWTQQAPLSKVGYIGQFWHYLQLIKPQLNPQTLICGDFNSNRIWDKPGRTWNHTQCVRELDQLGFRSLYHFSTGELQGTEYSSTFYLHRHTAKPFHIDFIFAHAERMATDWSALQVGAPEEWLAFSDHMPIIVDL